MLNYRRVGLFSFLVIASCVLLSSKVSAMGHYGIDEHGHVVNVVDRELYLKQHPYKAPVTVKKK